ncbi:MAG: O-antigen ligase family protein [Sulfurimonas sp.]
MIALQKENINFKKYISYILIAYAFSFPISKAATNFFEVLAILLWIVEGNWREKYQLYKTNLLSIAIVLLIGFSLLSILWHGNLETTLHYIAKYRHLLIIFVFYTSFQHKYTKSLLSAFLLSIFLSELVSYAIFFELIHYKDVKPEDPSPFMSHMTYSTVLAFTTAILLVYLSYEQHLRYKLFYIIFFISATVNLFINGGRTGQIIYIIVIATIFFSLIQHKVKALLGTLSILLIVFTLAYNFSPNFYERSHQLSTDINNMLKDNDYTGSGGSRVALMIIGLHTIKDNIILGTGPSYDMYKIQDYSSSLGFDPDFLKEFSDYHNAFITISAQLGIIGIFISLLIIYKLFDFHYLNKEYKVMSLVFAITFVLFSFTHNTLHTMNPMIFFALFAGLFNSLALKRIPNESR